MAKSGSSFSLRKWTNLLAYIAIICVAIAIVIGKWIPIIGEIGSILALVIVAICAFFYAKSKRNIAFMICYIVAVILIIVFKAWSMIG